MQMALAHISRAEPAPNSHSAGVRPCIVSSAIFVHIDLVTTGRLSPTHILTVTSAWHSSGPQLQIKPVSIHVYKAVDKYGSFKDLNLHCFFAQH